MTPGQARAECAQKLLNSQPKAGQLSAFIGLDGFVDEIVHAVDKRENAQTFRRLPTIGSMAERVAAAAGKSTNIELVRQLTKLGGNGPIMANALARLGVKVSYVGALGFPELHPVFEEFATRADVQSIAEPGHTDAIEFEDGKVMLVKSISLNDVTWDNLQSRFGRERFVARFGQADLVGFVNWTMIPYMSDLWESLLKEVCPTLKTPRRTIFFDLADPEKRGPSDIARALEIIGGFEKYFDVIFGLNEKEAMEVAAVLGIPRSDGTQEGLAAMSMEMQCRLRVKTMVVHPVTYALAVSGGRVDIVRGPLIQKPVITTGAGDHFNSGFCLGKLLGFENADALLCGVATSGFYVGSGKSPGIPDLAELMSHWPERGVSK